MNRMRTVIAATFAATLLAVTAPTLSYAQPNYPTKPIRLLIGNTAGGTPDTLARMIGPHLGEALGQPVVIENRPGASGVLAANILAKATPDGYTLLAVAPGFAVISALQPNLPFDANRDFAAVTSIGYSTNALVVAPSVGVKSAKELIALGHARPGKILFGSAGAGSVTHLNAERFRLAAGMKAVHVGFKGQPEFLIEIVAGRVHFGVAGLGPALPLIKDGRLLLLAVNPSRTPIFPDVPAMSEFLSGVGRDGSHMWLAPAGTPRAVLQRISSEVARIVNRAEVRERLQAISFHVAPATPEETARMLRADLATFNKLVVETGLRPK
jgi:tripartite-type tricarboxylate transporter receptor subunit TctC